MSVMDYVKTYFSVIKRMEPNDRKTFISSLCAVVFIFIITTLNLIFGWNLPFSSAYVYFSLAVLAPGMIVLRKYFKKEYWGKYYSPKAAEAIEKGGRNLGYLPPTK